MTPMLAAIAAACGTALVVTTPRGKLATQSLNTHVLSLLRPSSKDVGQVRQLAGACLVSFIGGAAACFTLFGTFPPALFGGSFAASLPLAVSRQRRRDRLEVAREAWPRMIDELRVLTSSAGRSIPQSILEIGSSAPAELRQAFLEARREWLLTSDLDRMLGALRRQLTDPTCDAVCETLLVAAELGGSDLDQRLTVLAEDRRVDSRNRREARARQAGVRFARRFVLLVPLGMAAAGLTVGSGGAAYRTPLGQLAVLVALAVTIGCWCWAGAMLRLPTEERVFPS
jgi:tight adherence protein B